MTLGLSGCVLNETDGWLWDTSVVGRWEHTPTVVPILDRIDVVEADSGDFVDVSQVTAEDLLPEPNPYRLQPGDFVTLQIEDIVVPGRPELYERSVDATGHIDIPQIGRIYAAGRTQQELQASIEQAMVDAGIDTNPLVNLSVPGQRGTTFSVFGAIQNPARYSIPYPEYRLLEALTDAGGLSPLIERVYVIRQIPLEEAVTSGAGTTAPTPAGTDRPFAPPKTAPRTPTQEAEDLNQLIEELTKEPPPPGAFGAGSGFSALSPALSESGPGRTDPLSSALSALDEDSAPAIDLDDTVSRAAPAAAPSPISGSAGQWVFVDGRWIQVMRGAPTGATGLPEGPDPLATSEPGADLVTQRVIEVPTGPLLKGVARYNIVVRPGDIIHVPPPEQGVVYAMGPGIQRAGTYSLPNTGQLTLQRLVAAAGGFSQVATPERVDLTRVVGDRGQATIRLNARAIFEGTHPDVRLKADDMVNFGTNFFATPMAVIRNGFRMSYGFGFLLDRNFGNDVFGAPPTRLEGN